MATRAEQLRYEQEREQGKKKRAKKQREQLAKTPRAGKARVGRTAAKATVSAEARVAGKRPSRKSTRSSANRLKNDTNLNLREERTKSSSDNRYRKGLARTSRVRGSS